MWLSGGTAFQIETRENATGMNLEHSRNNNTANEARMKYTKGE